MPCHAMPCHTVPHVYAVPPPDPDPNVLNPLTRQGKPGGEKTEFFSLESWQKYLSGDGPSPIQNLVSGSSGVSRLYQVSQ